MILIRMQVNIHILLPLKLVVVLIRVLMSTISLKILEKILEITGIELDLQIPYPHSHSGNILFSSYKLCILQFFF